MRQILKMDTFTKLSGKENGWTVGVRFPTGRGSFYLLHNVQTDFCGDTFSCAMSIGISVTED
jgi:hypothetical protein